MATARGAGSAKGEEVGLARDVDPGPTYREPAQNAQGGRARAQGCLGHWRPCRPPSLS